MAPGRTTADSLSVWLVPPARARLALAREIRALAERYGVPAFEPHVTLVSGVPPGEIERAREEVAALARRTPPLGIHLGEIGHANEYFRCLHLRVEPTPPLLLARASLRRTLVPRSRALYYPHLSLLYGALSARTRQAEAVRLGNKRRAGFVATRVRLQATRGGPEDWQPLAEYPLRGTPLRERRAQWP